jgi:hypothetical protein
VAVADWIRQQRRVYFGNASSVRDYRAQLRGTRPALFWTLYLGLLVLFVTLAYANIVSQGEQSVAYVQSQLQDFYKAVLGMLELMIGLVAPVIVGMSIQAEVQRKSLELVSTAPVTPKYFLVGKVLSGYRYILMLLFLSLPIAAVAVMLGGATWGEVLVSYLLLAMHGLLYVGISLPIAVISTKVVPAVIYSYMACWAWGLSASVGVIPYLMMGFGGPSTLGRQEAPFYLLMFPGAFLAGVDTYTVMFGTNVPNWIIATAVTLLVVKFFIVGAGSAMTRIGSKETVSLRIHGLVITAVMTLALSISMFPAFAGAVGSSSFSPYDPAFPLAIFFAVCSTPIVFALPHLSTWSYLDEHKNKPSGVFDIRKVLTGAPEGGLPYILMLLVTIFLVGGGVWVYNGGPITAGLALYAAWLTGAWVFFWSMGWVVSSFSTTGIATARKGHLAFTIIVTLLPWPVLSTVAAVLGLDSKELFRLYPIAALGYGDEGIGTVLFMTLEFWIAALVLTYLAERRRRSIVSSIERAINERKAA